MSDRDIPLNDHFVKKTAAQAADPKQLVRAAEGVPIGSDTPKVDWSVFDKYSLNEIHCQCGAVYRSHCKAVFFEGKMQLVTRCPCPACDKSIGHVRASRDTTGEIIQVGKRDVGSV